MSADGEQGGVRALAIEALANVTERLAPAGKYVARDIRNGILSSDNERAIWAMIEFSRRLQPTVTDTPDVVSDAVRTVISVVQAYLPPDGISQEHFIERVIEAVDNPAVYAALAKHPTSPEDAA